ncbi:hypothetical protein GCM10007908_05100 [Rhizobium albus]|nr:hypothetical protein GCM10007908_05100 [Rhizobium albus]
MDRDVGDLDARNWEEDHLHGGIEIYAVIGRVFQLNPEMFPDPLLRNEEGDAQRAANDESYGKDKHEEPSDAPEALPGCVVSDQMRVSEKPNAMILPCG